MEIGISLSITRPGGAVSDTTNDLLLESGSFILLEDGSKLLMEQ